MLRNIGNYFPGPVFAYEPALRVLRYTNDFFANALGYTQTELSAPEHGMDKLIFEDNGPGFESGVTACSALQGSSVHSFQCQITKKDGIRLPWRLTGTVLRRTEAGQAESILFFAHDITEEIRRAADTRELERKINELKRSNKDLEEFAYVASHDMHEPLRKVHSFAYRLKEKYGVSAEEEAKGYLDRILAATQNARLMIDGLMEFSRLSRNGFGFELVSMNDLVTDVLADLELKIEETGTLVAVGVLPQIEVIPVQMKQLFTNIILNAIKFRKEDATPQLNIQARMLKDSERSIHHLDLPFVYYLFTITDNGIGFEEEYAETIFQMFQRLNGKSDYPGSGIGLALCKRIADNHHGTIVANSTAGEGTVITVILPVKNKP